jgi:hypothetical protein
LKIEEVRGRCGEVVDAKLELQMPKPAETARTNYKPQITNKFKFSISKS